MRVITLLNGANYEMISGESVWVCWVCHYCPGNDIHWYKILKYFQSVNFLKLKIQDKTVQGGGKNLKILESTPSIKLTKKKAVLMRVEGNCCWTLHARRKFKVNIQLKEQTSLIKSAKTRDKAKQILILGCT